ncbi:MAG: lysophospholipase [Vicinamibacterales bacterium]
MIEELGWFTGSGGWRLRARSWLDPASPPHAVIALLHGGAEHSGRYQHTARRFTDAGFRVDAFDQRSHGASERVRGVGLQIERFDDLLDDTAAWLDHRRAEQPDLPVFVVAHSMGALIAITLAARQRLAVDGLVTLGAALTVIAPKAFARAAQLAASDPDAIVHRVPPGGSEDSTRDPAMRAVALADPLHADVEGVPARFLAEVARITGEVADELEQVRVPLLAVHGTADKMADPARSVELVERAGSTDKTLHLVEGGWHSLLRDLERATTEDVILNWINDRLV